jgi:hypothetical protein
VRYISAKRGAIFIQRAVSIRALAIGADTRPVIIVISSSVALHHDSVLVWAGRAVSSGVHYIPEWCGPVYRWVLLAAEKLSRSALGK